MTTVNSLNDDVIDAWADDPGGPVALSLKQRLVPVEGADGVLFPPTYADLEHGYNMDTLSDGTKVATIDSVGSQANRMEPMFKAAPEGRPANPLAALVPQVTIKLGDGRNVSLFDAGHRLGDAIVRSSSLRDDARKAFALYLKSGDASGIAKLSPTSLVFGVWDSRDTSAKVPRIVQAVVRAWNVDWLSRSAVYIPPVNYASLDVFSEEDRKKSEGDRKSPLAQRGFVHVPASGAPGGVRAKDGVTRDVTINLVALRRLTATEDGQKLRRYVLGLSLVAATEPLDGFYRQGCLVTLDPAAAGDWETVQRDGRRVKIALTPEIARSYAERAAKAFGVGAGRDERFDKTLALADTGEGAKKKSKSASATSAK